MIRALRRAAWLYAFAAGIATDALMQSLARRVGDHLRRKKER